MNFNPYHVLKIDRHATAEAIKRAFRLRSKETHPDHGGAAEDFDLVKRAHSVLGDPELKAHFDATGIVKERATENPDQAALGILAALLAAMTVGDTDVEHTDVLAMMRKHLDKEIVAASKVAAKHRQMVEKAQRMAERFTRRKADAPNMVQQMLAHRIDELNGVVTKIEAVIAQHQRASELLKEYDFRHDAAPPALNAFAFAGFADAQTFGR